MTSPFLTNFPAAWSAEKNLLELYGNRFHSELLEWIDTFYPDYEGFKEKRETPHGPMIFYGCEETMCYQYCHTVMEWWAFEQQLIKTRYGKKDTPQNS